MLTAEMRSRDRSLRPPNLIVDRGIIHEHHRGDICPRRGQYVAASVVDPDHFDIDHDPAFQFDTDPDPSRFKEVMYPKQFFTYILLDFHCQ